MRRRFAAAAVLIAVVVAPVVGLAEVNAQAPNVGGSDAGISLPIDMPAIETQSDRPAGFEALQQLPSPTVDASLPNGIAMPRAEMPQMPAVTSPSFQAPVASQSTVTAAPAAQSETPSVSDRDDPEAMPSVAPATNSAETTGETQDVPSEVPSALDLGAWIPDDTVLLDEPVVERATASPAAVAPAPVIPIPAFAAPMPAAVAPSSDSIAESESTEVVEEIPAVESEPVALEANVQRDVIAAPLITRPSTFAVAPRRTVTPATTSNVAAAPAVSEEESSNVEVTGTADSGTVETTAPGTVLPAPELPRISNPAPAPTLAIPTMTSLDMPGGLNLTLFVVLFGALGSAALGLHLLLRRIEASL